MSKALNAFSQNSKTRSYSVVPRSPSIIIHQFSNILLFDSQSTQYLALIQVFFCLDLQLENVPTESDTLPHQTLQGDDVTAYRRGLQ